MAGLLILNRNLGDFVVQYETIASVNLISFNHYINSFLFWTAYDQDFIMYDYLSN
jgi:hypothetical protein